MIYRKAPPQPTRLLLRIVAAAGATALVNVAACGGDVVANDDGDHDAGQACSADHVCGSLPSTCYTDSGEFICGLVDSGPGSIDGGLINDPCVDDAGNPTCGIMVNPDAGGGLIVDAGGTDE